MSSVNKKRVMAFAIAALMMLGMLAGCSQQDEQGAPSPSASPVETDAATGSPSTEPSASQPAATGEGADIVFKNGAIQTMVKEGDVAQAIAITGEEIVYVGDDAGVEEHIGANTNVIDLDGRFMSPGFMDGHIHAPSNWLDRLYGIALDDVFTNEEYLARIKEFVDAHPDQEVYTGAPFMLNAFMAEDGSNPGPSKADLDEICADKPIIIYDVAHHSIWTNSKGLEIGGITKDTPTPQGGAIAKDENGEPSGYLTDSAANLVTTKVDMSVTDEQMTAAVKEFQKEANSYGLTGITAIVGAIGDPNDSSTYAKLADTNDLSLRMRVVNTITPGTDPADAVETVRNTQKMDSEMVMGGTVKLFSDGVTESATAVMTEPYLEAAGMGADWKGEPVWQEGFHEMVAALDKEEIQVHVHAIGDGAVNDTLDSYEEAKEANGERDSRHSMTHVCAILDEDIQRVADLKVVSALQYLWMYADPLYELEAAFIGEERAMAMYPTKNMIDAGCTISGASDAPVTPYTVLDEIEVGVTRNSPYSGEDDTDMHRWPEQAQTAYQMLEIYTKNVAYQNFMEDMIGTIEVGKKADLVVLSDNILEVEPQKISDAKVEYTISNGKIVYEGK